MEEELAARLDFLSFY